MTNTLYLFLFFVFKFFLFSFYSSEFFILLLINLPLLQIQAHHHVLLLHFQDAATWLPRRPHPTTSAAQSATADMSDTTNVKPAIYQYTWYEIHDDILAGLLLSHHPQNLRGISDNLSPEYQSLHRTPPPESDAALSSSALSQPGGLLPAPASQKRISCYTLWRTALLSSIQGHRSVHRAKLPGLSAC